MPTYEYFCKNQDCNHEFEVFQSMKDDSLTDCPTCEQPTLQRKIGLGAGIIFKGSGFYETDYKKSPQENKKNDSSSTEAKADTPKTESKKKESTSKP